MIYPFRARFRTWAYRLLALLLIAPFPSPSNSAEIPLKWLEPTQNVDGSPLTDLVSYDIWYGCSQSGVYTDVETLLAPATTHTVTGLPDIGVCYFAGKAVNSQGVSSVFSKETIKVVELPGTVSDIQIEWRPVMAATFTNTENTGWAFATDENNTTADITVTLPSDSADGVFHIAFLAEDGTTEIGNAVDVANITNEVNDLVLTQADTSGAVFGISTWQMSGAPPTTVGLGPAGANASEKRTGLIIAITGFDTTTPVKEIVTGVGTGTAITYPASTATATTDDLVLHVVVIDSGNPVRELTGQPGTLIKKYTGPNFGISMISGFQAGAGTTVAEDSSSTTSSESDGWVAATIIIAGAASTEEFLGRQYPQGVNRGVMRGVK